MVALIGRRKSCRLLLRGTESSRMLQTERMHFMPALTCGILLFHKCTKTAAQRASDTTCDASLNWACIEMEMGALAADSECPSHNVMSPSVCSTKSPYMVTFERPSPHATHGSKSWTAKRLPYRDPCIHGACLAAGPTCNPVSHRFS